MVGRYLTVDAAHCAFHDYRSAYSDDCCPVPDDSCQAHSAATPAHYSAVQERCWAGWGDCSEGFDLRARCPCLHTRHDRSGGLRLVIHFPLAPLGEARSDGSCSDFHPDLRPGYRD